MPRLPFPPKRDRFRILSVFFALALSQSCMEPLYFEGRPPGPATLGMAVRALETLDGVASASGYLMRSHLELSWNIDPIDYRARAHLIELSNGSGSRTRRIDLHRPSDTLLDTFVCEQGAIKARLMVRLGPETFLLLSEQSRSTYQVEP